MICRGCNNFLGNPCAVCRTASRIQFFLVRNEFPGPVEARLLSVLRQAAGEISDLAEKFGRFRVEVPAGASGATPRASGNSDEKEAPPGGEKVAAKADKKEKKSDSEKKAAKEAKKEEKRKRAGTGAEEAPGSSKGPLREEAEADEDPEAVRLAKATPLIKSRRGKDKREPNLQDTVDRYVASNPGEFGLESLSIRGSAADHFRKNDERRREKPPEPEGPPPGDRTIEEPRPRSGGSRRPRSRSPRKKSKGQAHRQRGRDFWRHVRQQESWRQKPGQRRRRDNGRQG